MISAFSNLYRVKLISCLSKGAKNVTELISVCGLSQSAVSQHLMKLRSEGVVKCTQSGREKLYELEDSAFGEIANQIVKLHNKKAK